uniref:Peptidase A2 domain-containing protein n=1 Tax=Schistocephalus solidus TaxID=70667 RepID=A0A183T688_SCHSO
LMCTQKRALPVSAVADAVFNKVLNSNPNAAIDLKDLTAVIVSFYKRTLDVLLTIARGNDYITCLTRLLLILARLVRANRLHLKKKQKSKSPTDQTADPNALPKTLAEDAMAAPEISAKIAVKRDPSKKTPSPSSERRNRKRRRSSSLTEPVVMVPVTDEQTPNYKDSSLLTPSGANLTPQTPSLSSPVKLPSLPTTGEVNGSTDMMLAAFDESLAEPPVSAKKRVSFGKVFRKINQTSNISSSTVPITGTAATDPGLVPSYLRCESIQVYSTVHIPTAAATVKRQRQPVMVTTAAGQSRRSRLFYIADKSNSLGFLVDTGAEAANNTAIHTYGQQSLRRRFQCDFIQADVQMPIIGADFLSNFGVAVD